MLGLGTTHIQVDLVGTGSKAQILERLKVWAAKLPKDTWLVGRGWDQNHWAGKQFPTAADLDAVFPDRPVYLERIDGHAVWVNSAAMKLATKSLDGDWQPDGGRILRVGQKASGVLVDGAQHLVGDAMPPLSHEQTRDAYKAAGHPGKPQVYLRVPMYVADTDDKARAESEASILQFYKNHAQNLLEAARKIGEKAAIERAKGAEALLNMTWGEALGSISYEIATGIGARVPRTYPGGGTE